MSNRKARKTSYQLLFSISPSVFLPNFLILFLSVSFFSFFSFFFSFVFNLRVNLPLSSLVGGLELETTVVC